MLLRSRDYLGLILTISLSPAGLFGQRADKCEPATLPAAVTKSAEGITSRLLRDYLSFIATDEFERDTPSSASNLLDISAFAQGKSDIEGVWQLTEITMPGMTMKVTQPSVYIFTKMHYSKVYVASDKPRPVLDDYSKASGEQLFSIFVDGFDANSGTYEVMAEKLTLHPIVAKSPSDMKDGNWSTYMVKISGNTVTLTPETSNAGPSKKSLSYKLTRVE